MTLAKRRVAFVAPHSLVDPASGAAIATWRGLQLLDSCGFSCLAFCAARLDAGEEICFEETLSQLGLRYDVRTSVTRGGPAKLIFTRFGHVPITVFRNQWTQLGPTPQDAPAFLAAYEAFLVGLRPEVIVTYGGGPLGDAMIRMAKQRGIPVVFWLHNFAYHDRRAFDGVDQIIVPSEFSRQFHREKLGIECRVLPCVVDPVQVAVVQRTPKYLTFVNPQATKGLYVVARIAHELAQRRPDIPILVVESRARGKILEQTGIDLSGAKNLFGMHSTTDPRKFYAVSRAMLMPSLWNESFGLVAAEAMQNGIPVLASNRGALPEVVGDGGILLDIPSRYTPATTDVPSAEEVAPWLAAIERLWDDEAFYHAWSEKALARGRTWTPEQLRPMYTEFFAAVGRR